MGIDAQIASVTIFKVERETKLVPEITFRSATLFQLTRNEIWFQYYAFN